MPPSCPPPSAHSRLTGALPERVVRVLPTLDGPDKAFDYLVPDEVGDQVRVGARVRIPLGGRRIPGWVIQDWVVPPPGVALRPLAGVRGWGPPPAVVALAHWAAWRWAGRVAHFLAAGSPEVVVRSLPAPPKAGPDWVGAAGAAGPGGSGWGEVRDLAEGALGGASLSGAAGRVVLRIPPAADRWPVVEAAVAHVLGVGGRGVLVLAPSVEGANQVARRLRRSGIPVALLPGDWAVAAAGGCVVVGARGAAWAPLPFLGAVVVLDAHDQAYQGQAAPTWVATEVVAERARQEGVPCLLVSPCPTLELAAGSRLATVSRRAERAGWPVTQVIDMRQEDPRTGLFSPVVVARARQAGAGHQVLCVLNRKGRARLLACSACRELVRCETCGAALAQDGTFTLACPRCGLERPSVCAACGATRLRFIRVGVTRAAEELAALVGGPVPEVTGSSVPGEGLRQSLVMGTEAVLHRVAPGSVEAVVFLDFDQELLAPRYQAGEAALALLTRASRLVGGRGAGRVLVQTRLPDHPVLAAAVRADPGRLASAEMELRSVLRLPPVSALALVSGPAAEAWVVSLQETTQAGVDVLGPADDRYLVKALDHQILCDALAAVARPPGRLRVEVDPRKV